MVEYSRPMYSSSGLLPASSTTSAGAGGNLVFTPTTTGSTFGTVPLMGSTTTSLPAPVDKIDLYEKRVIEQPVLHQVVHHPIQEIHQQHIRNDVYTPPVTQVVNEGDFSYSSLPMTSGVGMVPATAFSGIVQQQQQQLPIGQGFTGSAPVSALSVPVPETRVPISTTQQYVGGGFAGTGVGAPSTYSDIGGSGRSGGFLGLGGGGGAPGYGGGAGMGAGVGGYGAGMGTGLGTAGYGGGAGMGTGAGGYGAGMSTGVGTAGYGGAGAGYGGTKESFFEKRRRRKMEKAMMQQNQWPGAQPQQFGSTVPVSSGIIPSQQLPAMSGGVTQPLMTQQQPILQQTSVLPSSSFVGGGSSSSMLGRTTGGSIPLSSGTYQSGIPSTTGSYINAPGSSRTGLF